MNGRASESRCDIRKDAPRRHPSLWVVLGILFCWTGFLYILGIVKTPEITRSFAAVNLFSAIPDRAILFGVVLVVIGGLLIIASSPWTSLPWRIIDEVVAQKGSTTLSRMRGVWLHRSVLIAASVVYVLVLVWVYSGRHTHAVIAPFIAALIAFGWTLRRQGSRAAGSFVVRTSDLLVVAAPPFLLIARYWADIPSWYFSFWGDERPFFTVAKALLHHAQASVFLYEGVYGKFPIADSYLVAVFLALIGDSIVGWKVGSVAILGLTCGAVYCCGAVLFDRWVGALAALFLAANHYLGAFGLIGYNNLHMCLTSTVGVTLFAASYRNRSLALAYAAGVVCGLMTYSIWGGLILVPLIFLLVLCLGASRGGASEALRTLAALLFGFILAALPGLISNPAGSIARVAHGLSHGKGYIGGVTLYNTSWDSWASLSTSLVALFRNDWWGSHYVYASLVDPITGFLVVLGLGVIAGSGRSWGATILFVWFIGGLLGVVLLSRLNTPYLTRLVFIMPPLTLVGGVGVVWLVQNVSSQLGRAMIVTTIIGAVIVMNAQLLYVASPSRGSISPHRLIIREIQHGNGESFILVVPGSQVDLTLQDLVRDYTPRGKRVVFIAEGELRQMFGTHRLASEIPENATVLAEFALDSVMKQLSMERFGGKAVIQIAPEGAGHGIVAIGGRVGSSVRSEIRPVPEWLRSVLGMI